MCSAAGLRRGGRPRARAAGVGTAARGAARLLAALGAGGALRGRAKEAGCGPRAPHGVARSEAASGGAVGLAWASAGPPPPWRRRPLLVAAGSAACCGGLPGVAGGAEGDYGLVLDDAGLLSPSTGEYIDALLAGLERDTGAKVRVLCPPARLRFNAEAWKEYLRPVYKKMRVDTATLAITAEISARTLGKSRKQVMDSLIQMNMGFRLQERFQYGLTNNFLSSVANHFGAQDYVERAGTDAAIRDAAENVAASIYSLVDREAERKRGPAAAQAVYQFWIPAEDVAKILARHGVARPPPQARPSA